jgi:hypothetical protein
MQPDDDRREAIVAFNALLDALAAAREENQRLRAGLSEAVEILEDAWNQWAYDGTNGKWAGGLSTLEWIEEALPRLAALAAAGLPVTEGERDGE